MTSDLVSAGRAAPEPRRSRDARARRSLPSVQSLRVFEAAARLHGVGLAARELHITPSAASRQLESLEAKLGVPLVVPGVRPVALSKSGQSYLWTVQFFLKAIRLSEDADTEDFPSMRSLLAFEAAAQSLSFHAAGPGLFISPSAVSQQVRLLEAQLGWKLFIRLRNGLLLTEPGYRFLLQIQNALNALEDGTSEMRGNVASVRNLTICAISTFATEWLIPRLRDFSRQHPDVQLSFVAGSGAVDFDRSAQVDAFITYGRGTWPGSVSDALASDPMVVVAAPELAGACPVLPAQLSSMPLLHHSLMPHAWSEWFQAAGVDDTSGAAGYRFEQFGMLVQAAVAGLGVGLVPLAFAQRHLQSGALVSCVQQIQPYQYSYWLVYLEALRRDAAFAAFRNWLLRASAPAAGDAELDCFDENMQLRAGPSHPRQALAPTEPIDPSTRPDAGHHDFRV